MTLSPAFYYFSPSWGFLKLITLFVNYISPFWPYLLSFLRPEQINFKNVFNQYTNVVYVGACEFTRVCIRVCDCECILKFVIVDKMDLIFKNIFIKIYKAIYHSNILKTVTSILLNRKSTSYWKNKISLNLVHCFYIK